MWFCTGRDYSLAAYLFVILYSFCLIYFNKFKHDLVLLHYGLDPKRKATNLTGQTRKAALWTADTNAHAAQVCRDVIIALMRNNLDQSGASAEGDARSLMRHHLQLLPVVMQPCGDR